ECVVVTLFYRRDFLFSIYTKYFTLSANAEKSKISRPNGTKFLVFCFDKYAKKYQLKAWEKNYS
ncbi:hypothetical protein, partial [Enterococcus faecium]